VVGHHGWRDKDALGNQGCSDGTNRQAAGWEGKSGSRAQRRISTQPICIATACMQASKTRLTGCINPHCIPHSLLLAFALEGPQENKAPRRIHLRCVGTAQVQLTGTIIPASSGAQHPSMHAA
jgi:hypothetical protein